MPKREFQLFQKKENQNGKINDNKKWFNHYIYNYRALYSFRHERDHNFKRAVDACVAGSQKLSETKITDLNEAKKFCEDQIRKNNEQY